MAKFENNLEVICLESEAFYALIDEVVNHIKHEHSPILNKWISDKEAMALLGISSRTTLQRYRDEGLIRFSQHSRKIILYDRDSILEFLEAKAQNTF